MTKIILNSIGGKSYCREIKELDFQSTQGYFSIREANEKNPHKNVCSLTLNSKNARLLAYALLQYAEENSRSKS